MAGQVVHHTQVAVLGGYICHRIAILLELEDGGVLPDQAIQGGKVTVFDSLEKGVGPGVGSRIRVIAAESAILCPVLAQEVALL